eukprot:2613634-Pleurochrysis_carterae.AAC.1
MSALYSRLAQLLSARVPTFGKNSRFLFSPQLSTYYCIVIPIYTVASCSSPDSWRPLPIVVYLNSGLTSALWPQFTSLQPIYTLHPAACLLHLCSLQEPFVLAVVTDSSLEHEVITSAKETMHKLA